MNKNRYRLVFNMARGLWMAVAEIVKARGKAASPVVSSSTHSSAVYSLHCTLRPLRLALLGAWGGLLVAAPMAQADIVADSTAATGQRPEVTQAANGVTLVNIQRPGAAGVSHNLYHRFNVDAEGALLNNARTPVKTQLAGWVNGNPNLVGGTARIILNEVNSDDPSILRGYLEVAGDRAQVIVANPSGITCAGCGFINASRSTLTTGQPIFDSGNLSGFDVRGGELRIEGNGLDGRQSDYTDLIARAVTVNAGIWANELNLVTGANQVSLQGAVEQKLNPNASQPSFALDVKALGGMYAGKITLIGTEYGVGVRNAGQIGAPVGELRLTADGRLENSGTFAAQDLKLSLRDALDNSGVLSADNDLSLQVGKSVDNQGTLYAARDTTITAAGFTNRIGNQGRGGVISSGQDLRITVDQSGGVLDNQANATLAAGIERDGSQGQTGSLYLSVNGVLQGQGRQSAAEHLILNAASIKLDNGQTQAENIQLTAVTGDVSNRAGALYANEQLTIDVAGRASQTLDNHQGQISAYQLQINAGQLINVDGLLINTGTTDSQLTVAGTLDNNGGRIASNSDQLSLTANLLDNRQGEVVHAGNSKLSLQLDTLQGTGGTLASNSLLTIDSDALILDDGTTTANGIQIQTGNLSHQRGDLVSTAPASLNVQATLDNRNGQINLASASTLLANQLLNSAGLIHGASGQLNIAIGNLLDNQQGTLSAQQLLLAATALDNRQGVVKATGAMSLQLAGALDNRNGQLVTNSTLTVQSQSLDNQSGLVSSRQGDLMLTSSGFLQNGQGRIESGATTKLTTGGMDNCNGEVLGGALQINTQQQTLDNRSGQLIAQRQLNLRSGALNNSSGLLQSGEDMVVDTQGHMLDNSATANAGGINSRSALTLSTGDLNNTNGYLGASGTLLAQLGRLDNSNQGLMLSEQQLQLSATRIDNRQGSLQSKGDQVLTVSGVLDNQVGTLLSEAQLTLRAAVLDNRFTPQDSQGVQAQKVLINVDQLHNQAGRLLADQTLQIEADTHLNNQDGQLSAGNNLQLTAPRLDNTRGSIQSGNRLILSATDLINIDTQTGRQGLQADQVDLDFVTLDNRQGRLLANQQLTLHGSGQLDNRNGLLSSMQALQLSDSQNQRTLRVENQQGRFVAGAQLQLSSYSIQGDGELLALGDLTLSLAGDLSNQGELISNGDLTVTLQGDLTNAGKLAAGGTLSLAAGNIDNQVGAGISASANHIQTSGTLSNQGLIDGSLTRIVADTLDNFGTGRIYGDQLAIQATSLNNRDHNQNAAVIASRGDLDLGAGNLSNTTGALIFSVGDLRIGGSLDSNDRVIGKTGQLINSSAGIESLGELQITATQLLNQNTGFRKDTQHTLVNQPFSERRYVNSEDYYERTYVRNEYEDVIGASDPGRMVSAGDMTLNVEQVINDKSHILAGGTLTLNAVQVDNLDATLERRQEDIGQERFSWIEYCRRGKSKCRRYGPYSPYQPPAKVTSIPVTVARLEQQSTQTVNAPGLSAHQMDSINPTLQAVDNSIDAAQTVTQSLVAQQQLVLTSQSVTLSSVNGNDQNPVVRTGGQLIQLPRSALFSYQTSPGYSVLIETDPRFANYRNWLSSDYMLDRLQLDPASTMKRLGDGFYEQRLVQQQITQLTGQRYLVGYQSDEEQFKALMNAGVTFALAYDLTPGVALTTEQMAHLTSDLVWLVEQTVVMNDGSRHSVLVPQLYAVLEQGDINGRGALLGGEQVAVNLSGDLLNEGTVQSVDSLNLSAVNIRNRRGSFTARSAQLTATQDVDNEAGLMQGRDRLVVQAGRDLTVRAATREGFNQVGASQFERIHLDGIGTLQVLNPEGQLAAAAGRDLTLTSAAVINEGEAGTTDLSAGRNLQLDTTETRQRDAIVWDSRNYRTEDLQREIGTAIQTEGDLTLTAGNDLSARAAQISSNGHLRAFAEGDIAIEHGTNSDHNTRRQVIQSSGFLSSKTTIDESRSTTRSVHGSTLSADDITLQSGQDLTITGSQLVATESVNLNAGRQISIQSGQQISESYNYHQKKKSGLFSSGSGFGITLGTMQKSDQVDQQQTTQVSSTVGALNGDVNLNAGGDVTVTASDLLARQGSIRVEGANITLDSADDTLDREEEHKLKQSGLTLALSGGIIDTLQTIKSSVERIDSVEDGRLKALHAWRIGRIAKNLPEDFKAPATANNTPQSSGINLSISLGSSSSQQQISQQNRTALGSSLIADDQIQITARGSSGNGNPGSPEEEISGGDINLRGALLEADQITLNAANELNLSSAENHSDYNETSKSKSAGIGISIGSDGLLFFVEGSRSRGLVNQSDDHYLETLINAKEKATLISGGDTTLKGAQVNARRIEVNSGGDLNIISQQDEEHFKKRNQSIGGRVGIGYGRMSVSINASKLKADSEYIAVQEQSGLFAGTGGFDVQVQNHTDLQAGAIVSEAEPENNRFSTGSLSYNAIDNHAKYDVESKSISFSSSGSSGPTKGFGGGASSDSGEAQNTTYAAISEGDITIRSNPNQSLDELKKSKEEAHRVLERIFSEEMVQQMQEEVEFAQLLSEEGPRAIGDYADSQLTEANELRHLAKSANAAERDALNAEADRIEANWKESGHLRIALHAFVGGLGNGLEGVVGAGITASAIPHIDGLLEKSGVSKETRKAILIAASAGVGGLVGGQPGALASMGQTVNNYLSHLEATRLNELKKHLLTCEADCSIDAVRAEIKALEGLDRHRDEYARIVCALPTSAACGQVIGQMQVFREGYLAAGPSSMLSRQKIESNQLAEQLFTYRQRAANPGIYNSVKGVGTSIGTGIEGTLDLGLLAGNAVLGDEHSQEMLVQIAAATKAFLAHPVDNTEKAIKTKLDEIDRLEESGQTDLAHQKRAELYTSGAFTVTGAGALAITGGKVVIAGSKLAVSGSKALVNNAKKAAGSAAEKIKSIDWAGFVGDTGGDLASVRAGNGFILGGGVVPGSTLAKRGIVEFQGLEVRAVRDLSHLDEGTLRAMQEYGFAAKDAKGNSLVLHHHLQDPAGPIIEIPAANHSIRNARQHPFGNEKGLGLTAEERAQFNQWRSDYWKSRAVEELKNRGLQ